MYISFRTALGAVACALAAGTAAPVALAQGMQHGAGSSPMDMKSMMKENNDKMASMPMTGNPDVDFAMMMRIHHQGAIRMAQMQLQNGKDPAMRRMAQKIIAAQRKEIAQFDKYLEKHGQAPGK